MEPVLDDQYLTARVYFLCVLGLVLSEPFLRIPLYVKLLLSQGMLYDECLQRLRVLMPNHCPEYRSPVYKESLSKVHVIYPVSPPRHSPVAFAVVLDQPSSRGHSPIGSIYRSELTLGLE
jgi:hypothetical protein